MDDCYFKFKKGGVIMILLYKFVVDVPKVEGSSPTTEYSSNESDE